MHSRRNEAVVDLALRHSREMTSMMEGGIGAAREKFKELYQLKLEWIENDELRKEWEEDIGEESDLPVFSEVALYSLLGKENARTVLAYLKDLGEALGFSRMEMQRRFKKPEGGDDLPCRDDLDALEAMLRGEAAYMIGNPDEKLPRMMRALELVRTVVGANGFTDGVEYLRLYPKDLRIGDRIVERGKFVDVLGFFNEKRRPRKTPVADKVKDDDREVRRKIDGKWVRIKEPYWGAHVKIRESDTHGWAVRSQDKLLVQRKVEPGASPDAEERARGANEPSDD